MRLGGAVGMVADENGDDDADYMQYTVQYCTLMYEDLWWDYVSICCIRIWILSERWLGRQLYHSVDPDLSCENPNISLVALRERCFYRYMIFIRNKHQITKEISSQLRCLSAYFMSKFSKDTRAVLWPFGSQIRRRRRHVSDYAAKL